MTAAHGEPLTGEHQWFKHQRWFAVFGGVKSRLGMACSPHTALFCVIFRKCDAFVALLMVTISQQTLTGGVFFFFAPPSKELQRG